MLFSLVEDFKEKKETRSLRQQKGECLVNESKRLKQNKQGKYREEEEKKVRTSFTPMPTHVDCSDARKTNNSQKKKEKYIYREREAQLKRQLFNIGTCPMYSLLNSIRKTKKSVF